MWLRWEKKKKGYLAGRNGVWDHRPVDFLVSRSPFQRIFWKFWYFLLFVFWQLYVRRSVDVRKIPKIFRERRFFWLECASKTALRTDVYERHSIALGMHW